MGALCIIMRGNVVISELKKKLRASTDRALALRIGITVQAIQNWKNRRSVTPRQLAGLLASASRASARNFQTSAIKPLVEFFPIEPCESRHGANYEIFDRLDTQGKLHPYRSGLKQELAAHHGIYVFFDSRGQAIYTGKAQRQSLWREINLAFNRARGQVQMIKRVRHPERKQIYRTSDEKARQISEHVVPLYELAVYFSAYQVANSMIDDLEALLVRSFANDLLNVRMERFLRDRRSIK
jgi:hypothetical protein